LNPDAPNRFLFGLCGRNKRCEGPGAKVVADHLRTGEPLFIERDGTIVLMPAEEWIALLAEGKNAPG